MASSSRNTTNQERIARALNRTTGCGYQKALQRVQAAADAGKLPAKLDQAGREEAVRMLTDNDTQPAPAPVAVTSGPTSPTHSPVATRGLVRGGPDKTVGALDTGALAQPGNRALPVDLPESLTGLTLETHQAMEALRNLRNKKRFVDAMRAERDQGLRPYLLPAASPELMRQMELLLEQTRRLPRSDKPQ
ncbi:hypothetical protein [Streptomyces lavenduligriseus]|uniref:Uncharacterized protein n=1 Tax=Streptomyces lavenduligriseus TaxID=67315 RepID=A0ABT0P5N6_9ACTN|nr:hypothetical protein [Streptomyces lavenduligriseus]MCL3998905.1 hypothetical protein [Streptomyces lavenduligriseus]